MPSTVIGGFRNADECQDAFYAAMRNGDADAMRRVWLANAGAVCIHPGSLPLQGFDAVLKSWHSILRNGSGIRVQFEPRSRVAIDRIVIHTGLEVIRTGEDTTVAVTVTNIYELTAEGWKMRLHHGAPVQARPSAPRPLH